MGMELLQTFENVEKIEIYNQGNKKEFIKTDEEFKEIMCEWEEMCIDAIKMPAFGVSLNNETKSALNLGVWVNFIFERRQIVDGMIYESLLVQVEKEWQGFNLHRYNCKTGFNGRCFYLHLNNKNMTNLYNIIVNL